MQFTTTVALAAFAALTAAQSVNIPVGHSTAVVSAVPSSEIPRYDYTPSRPTFRHVNTTNNLTAPSQCPLAPKPPLSRPWHPRLLLLAPAALPPLPPVAPRPRVPASQWLPFRRTQLVFSSLESRVPSFKREECTTQEVFALVRLRVFLLKGFYIWLGRNYLRLAFSQGI